MTTKKWINEIAFYLVIIAGINYMLWGLIPESVAGPDGFDLIRGLLDNLPATLGEIVYLLIGIAAIYLAYLHLTERKARSAK